MHYRDSYAVIDTGRLNDNVAYIKKSTNKDIIAVVKADAYGCGYQEVAKTLQHVQHVKAFAVATLKEALSLRDIGIDKDILVLGAISIDKENIARVQKEDITLTIFSLEYANKLLPFDVKGIRVQIKIDTGMHRIGLSCKEELDLIYPKLVDNGFVVEGVFTHFATADDNVDHYNEQKELFYKIIDGYDFKYIHLDNSAAVLLQEDDRTNLARVGIGMYGIDPSFKVNPNLKQVMSLYARVIQVQAICKGDYVGYGYTYQAKKDTYIATVPLGYGDGFIRLNQGRDVYINGKFYPIVGRVCMDQMMIEVDQSIQVDDIVEIFGDHISLIDMAKQLNTIPYEIMCLISMRIERVYK